MGTSDRNGLHSTATVDERSSAGERRAAGGSEAAPALRFGDAWDYAPAPETTKVTIEKQYELFINGAFVKPTGSEHFDTINPANETVLSKIAQAGEKDVDKAVKAARAAFPKWAALPAKERGKYLYRIARRIQERARELAIIETMDGGKPIKESRDVDIPLVAQHFFYHAGWADKLKYAFPFPGGSALRAESSPANRTSRNESDSARRAEPPRPLGVCGQIIPWNFPLLMAAWKIAPALACGNTVVLKPAETTSLTALRLAEIIAECDLPPGVVNIVTGDGRTGAALAGHPDLNKLAFTGSTEVGKKLAAIAAPTGLKLTLELGGKSANIIFDDASIDQAVEGIVSAIYFNQGHVCCAGSRLLVQEGIADAVIQKLENRLASLRVGDPMDKNTDVGAINSKEQLKRIRDYCRVGVEEGAELREPCRSVLPNKGYYFKPAFFTGVQQSHRIAREEIFGPLLAVMTFRTPEEAIMKANNTPYGLAAGVWTDKGSKIFELAGRLKAGVVWCNTYNQFDAASPFGGYKESGFGREGGLQGLRGYLEI